jgi:ABC-type nickel/cobalt efflux system permease component RcnA
MPTQPGLKGLIALGISGGLLPCPTALVVMLGAIALDRTAYGLALVLAFSIGLAGVLTGIGLLLVFARRMLEGSSARLRFLSPALTRRAIQALPVLSSLGIVAAGLLITGNALSAV